MAQGDPVYVSGTSPKYLEICTLLGARTNFTTWGTDPNSSGGISRKTAQAILISEQTFGHHYWQTAGGGEGRN